MRINDDISNWLTGIASVVIIVVLGLFLTKHLVVVSQQRMVNVIDDSGKVLFQMATNATVYEVEFVK